MKLRKALEDTDESIIKTIPRFGYRFVAEIEEQVVVPNMGFVPIPPFPPGEPPVFTAIAILAMFTAAVFLIDSPTTVTLARSVKRMPGGSRLPCCPLLP